MAHSSGAVDTRDYYLGLNSTLGTPSPQHPEGAQRPAADRISKALVRPTPQQGASSMPVARQGISAMVTHFAQLLLDDVLRYSRAPCNVQPSATENEQAVDDLGGEYQRTGTCGEGRTLHNAATPLFDGSVVYGASPEATRVLRAGVGGRVHVYPDAVALAAVEAVNGSPCQGADCVGQGELRTNPHQVGTLAALVLVLRKEHNRLAAAIGKDDPTLGDDAVFAAARRLVVAKLQAIAFGDFAPALLGGACPRLVGGLSSPPRRGPGLPPPPMAGVVSAEFGLAMQAVLLTSTPEVQLALEADGQRSTSADEAVTLARALGELGIAPGALGQAVEEDGRLTTSAVVHLLRGAAAQKPRAVSLAALVESRVMRRRSILASASRGADRSLQPEFQMIDVLASLVRQGRDHGVLSYNDLRKKYGLPRIHTFEEVTPDRRLAKRLDGLYGMSSEVAVTLFAEPASRRVSDPRLSLPRPARPFQPQGAWTMSTLSLGAWRRSLSRAAYSGRSSLPLSAAS
jgi:peroxidase